MSSVNLFMLPFAGGSKYSYNTFVAEAPAELNVISLDLPGRGARIREPLLKNSHDMVDDILRQIKGQLSEPYIIYGHSMGALLAYLLMHRLGDQSYNMPVFSFLTGCSSPELIAERVAGRHLLPKKEFIEKLRNYGGSPEEVLKDEALLAFFEPILRADFEAVGTYQHQCAKKKLNTPLSVIIGEGEDFTTEDVSGWREQSTKEVELHQFPGRHFFIFEHVSRILEMINIRVKRELIDSNGITF